ncbi:MAG: iron-containing redox enzyme family protein [Deltaproteobacteria bacterium]|nr:iron-containing redox enzyme family protein [Deltaproteobacteria bacterium]
MHSSTAAATATSTSRSAPAGAPLPDWLARLRHEVEAHRAVHHPLLQRLSDGHASRADFLAFGRQHFALVGFFTKYMEALLFRAPTSADKLWLAKVLVNEYGEGSDGLDHAQLYLQFLAAAGLPPGDERSTALCAEAFAFVGDHLRICCEEPLLVGLGALGPGHEWAIPSMFARLLPGLRAAGFSERESLYFSLHCEQDLDHGAWMTEVLAKEATTLEQQELVRRGARRSLAARERFWDGVLREVAPDDRRHAGRHAPASPGQLGDLRARAMLRVSAGSRAAPRRTAATLAPRCRASPIRAPSTSRSRR